MVLEYSKVMFDLRSTFEDDVITSLSLFIRAISASLSRHTHTEQSRIPRQLLLHRYRLSHRRCLETARHRFQNHQYHRCL